MTPEHPLTKDIEQKAVDLRRQLLALEDDPLPIPPTPNLVEARVPEAQIASICVTWRNLVERSQEQYEVKLEELRQAERNLEAAQDRQSKALAVHAAILNRLPPTASSFEVTSMGTASAWTFVGWAGAMILLTGTAARGIYGWRSRAARTMRRMADIEKKCSLRVIGVVSAATSPRARHDFAGTTGVRGLALLLHVLIALAVFLLVAMTVQNPNWVGQMATQPYDAISAGLEHLLAG